MTSKSQLRRLVLQNPLAMAARIYELEAEVTRLSALSTCGCGDQFTTDDPGVCGNCFASENSSLNVKIDELVHQHKNDESANKMLLRLLDEQKARET